MSELLWGVLIIGGLAFGVSTVLWLIVLVASVFGAAVNVFRKAPR